jgi:hypothetical protein
VLGLVKRHVGFDSVVEGWQERGDVPGEAEQSEAEHDARTGPRACEIANGATEQRGGAVDDPVLGVAAISAWRRAGLRVA